MSNITPEIIEHLKSKGYRAVEYIGSTGTQYIDLGLKLNYGDIIDCDINLLNSGEDYQRFCGAYVDSYDFFRFLFQNYNWFSNNEICIVRTYGYITGRLITGERHRYTAHLEPNIIVTEVDGLFSASDNVSNYIPNRTIFIFAENNAYYGGAYAKTYARLYHFSIKNRLDLYPCYNISTGAIGLYDMVSDSFFGNNGTGVFLKGADIPDPVYYYGNEKAELLLRRRQLSLLGLIPITIFNPGMDDIKSRYSYVTFNGVRYDGISYLYCNLGDVITLTAIGNGGENSYISVNGEIIYERFNGLKSYDYHVTTRGPIRIKLYDNTWVYYAQFGFIVLTQD